MKEKFLELQKEFYKIRGKGYIRGIYNSSSSIGRTFENELNLSMNKESVPDFKGIEIKTRRPYSKCLMSLFNAVPDSGKIEELKRLRNRYGYPYHRDRRYKCVYIDAFSDRYTSFSKNYKSKINIDNKNRRIYLDIFNQKEELLEHKVYWSFDSLKEKLENKFTYLAIIHAWPNKIDGWNYFKYFSIKFYMLKNFKRFLNLINNGKIRLQIKVDIYLDKDNYGRMYDHGCSFSIAEEDITKLFYEYNPRTGALV